MSMKSERKGDYFIMRRADKVQRWACGCQKKWKDIRHDTSLGYQDLHKRDKLSWMARIKEFIADIKDFPENI